jgi:hypothetical protein
MFEVSESEVKAVKQVGCCAVTTITAVCNESLSGPLHDVEVSPLQRPQPEGCACPALQENQQLAGGKWPAIVRETIQGAINTRLITAEDQIVSIYHRYYACLVVRLVQFLGL